MRKESRASVGPRRHTQVPGAVQRDAVFHVLGDAREVIVGRCCALRGARYHCGRPLPQLSLSHSQGRSEQPCDGEEEEEEEAGTREKRKGKKTAKQGEEKRG